MAFIDFLRAICDCRKLFFCHKSCCIEQTFSNGWVSSFCNAINFIPCNFDNEFIRQLNFMAVLKSLLFFRGESVSVRCSLLNRTPQPLESVVVLAASEDYSFIQVNIRFMVVGLGLPYLYPYPQNQSSQMNLAGRIQWICQELSHFS